MRTLKKTLALVLCLAMIAGLCCFGTSAAFADAADIEYTEAAAVMNAIGVLKGDGTNFNPKGILTRAEAAVMLAKLIGEGNVKSTSTYKDMKGFEWAQQFAAVCEAKGFILGDGKGNFLPGNTLTGYQFGLMLCRALGYKPAQEGVESATYEIGTAALMKKVGLDKAIKNFDGTKGITREEAAALMLQALKTTMVEYTGGSSITINGAVITSGSTRQNVSIPTLASVEYIDTTATDVQLGEMYFDTLKLVPSAQVDAYNRPAAVWTYGKTNKEICRVGAKADYTATVTALTAAAPGSISDYDTASAAVNKVLGITNPTAKLSAGPASYYVNGVKQTPWANIEFYAGDYVEVFTGEDLTAEYVIITRESAAQIISVIPNTGKATTTIDGVPTVFNYTLTIDTNMDGTAEVTTNDLILPGYTADYVKGAYLQVVLKSGAIIDSAVTAPVTGAITAFSSGVSAAIGGTTYYMAGGNIPGYNTSVVFTGAEYALVLSSNGNILAVDTVSAPEQTLTNVVYTNGTSWAVPETKYGTTNVTVYLQTVALDGTVEDIVIGGYKKDAEGNNVASSNWGLISAGFAESISEGLYAKTAVPATATVPAYVSLSSSNFTTGATTYNMGGTLDNTGAGGLTFTAVDKKLAGNNANNYVTANTTYTLIKGSAALTQAVLYTGALEYKTTQNTEKVWYVTATTAGVTSVAAVVVSNSTLTTSTADMFYVDATTAIQTGATTFEQVVYDMTGAKKTITVDTASASITGFVTYGVNEKGVYTLTLKDDAEIGSDIYWNKNIIVDADVDFAKSFYADCINLNASTYTVYDITATALKVVDVRTAVEVATGYNGAIASAADMAIVESTVMANNTNYYNVDGAAYVDATGAVIFFVTGTSTGASVA